MMNFLEIDNVLYCSFSGRLDGLSCSDIEPELMRRTVRFKGDQQNVKLVFDLNGVAFISSAFLRLCLMNLKMYGKDHFSVTNVSKDIHKVFHISGFSEIMDVFLAESAA